MARRHHRTPTWTTEAFLALADRLRPFESTLGGRRLLEVRCGQDVGFGFLLDWLRPTQLVAVDVDFTSGLETRPTYGPRGAFDAAFVMARAQLKRAVRRISLPEVARVLSPGGFLIVTTLGQRPPWAHDLAAISEVDRSAEGWSLLHTSLASAGFKISEEHLGVSRLLVAQKPGVLGARA